MPHKFHLYLIKLTKLPCRHGKPDWGSGSRRFWYFGKILFRHSHFGAGPQPLIFHLAEAENPLELAKITGLIKRYNLSSLKGKRMVMTSFTIVVYFDRCLGVGHSKCWSKSSFPIYFYYFIFCIFCICPPPGLLLIHKGIRITCNSS